MSHVVTIYRDCYYKGAYVNLNIGNYPNIPSPVDNGQISSLRVPVGYTVILYENPNFGGQSMTILGPANIDCLWNSNKIWNDKAQSIKVIEIASVSIPTSQKVGNCDIVTSFDFPGNDLSSPSTGSLQECVSQCEQNPHCQGFSRLDSDGTCWIKNKMANKIPKSGFTSGICQKSSCGKPIIVNIPYNVGSQTLENCKEYTMNSNTHTVNFRIDENGTVQILSAQPLCGRLETLKLDYDLGTRQLQKCQTHALNTPSGSINVKIGPDGKVNYSNIQSYGTPLDTQKRLEYINTQYCYITNIFYNKQVSARQDNSVIGSWNRQAWEQWRFISADNNLVYIENNHFKGSYLTCQPDGTINLTKSKTSSSSWVLLKGISQYTAPPNQCLIKSSVYPYIMTTQGQKLTNANDAIKGQPFDINSYDKMTWDIAPYDSLRLIWSNTGPVPGTQALQINNPATNQILGSTWNQTYLCYSHEIGLVWALNDDDLNKFISQGYKATKIIESAEPVQHQWTNKWLCLPSSSFVDLKWASSDQSRNQLISQGYNIVKWYVPEDQYTWDDNYLGYKWIKRIYDNTQTLNFNLSVQAGGWNTNWCPSQPKTDQFFQVMINNQLIMSRSGKPLTTSGRGLNMCAFDSKNQPTVMKSYDTFANTTQSDNLINDATSLLKNNLVNLIIIGTTDEATNQLKNSVRIFLASQFGANYFSYLEYRGSYLLIFDNVNKKIIYEGLNNCGIVRFDSKCTLYCSSIFDAEWYVNHHPDLIKIFGDSKSFISQQKASNHWVSYGIKEGRQGSPNFFVKDYIELYPDVQKITSNNYHAAIQHYLEIGIQEGRKGIIFDIHRNKWGLINNYLQCYLDSRQNDSYPGQGDLWKDISGNNRNFQWKSIPQYDDGRFKYIGNTQAIGPPSNSFGLGNGKDGATVIVISRQREMSENKVFHFSEQSGNYGFSVHQTWNNNITYFDNTHGAPIGQNRISVDIGNRWNQTSVWAYVRTVSGFLQIYCNGQLLVTTNTQATPLNLSSSAVLINEYNWNADIAVFAVYNFGLLSNHIKDITDWWINSEKLRISNRDISMTNIIQSTIKDFPVPNGLQCYLDANYIQSYAGKGNDFFDLSPYKRHFKFQSQPNFLGNRISTTGNNKLSGPFSNSFNIDENSNYTIIWYAKTNSLSNNSAFQFYDINGPHYRGIFCHPAWTDQILYFDQAGCCQINHRLSTTIHGYWNQMSVYALVRDDNGRSIYINGTKMATIQDRGLILNLAPKSLDLLVTERYPIWNCEFSSFMVYNRGLPNHEIQDLYRWLVSGYEFYEYSWEQANQYCIDKGQRLCNYNEYCPKGPLNPSAYKLPQIDTWGPVSDSQNQWVQLGNQQNLCKLHTDICTHLKTNPPCQSDGKPTWGTQSNTGRRAILCCNPPKSQIYFDTIGQISDDLCLIFKNDVYIKYNLLNHISTHPFNIIDLKFPGHFSRGQFDACLNYQNLNLLYIFKDSFLIKFNYIENTITQPSLINLTYPGLPMNYQIGGFDSLLRIDPSQFIIFKGNQIVIYNENTRTATNPQRLIEYWPGLTSIFSTGQFTAVIQNRQSVIIFKENLYAVYTPDHKMTGPYNIVPTWRGLKLPLIRQSEECLIYNEQIRQLKKMKSNETPIEMIPGEIEKHIQNYQQLADKKCNFISYDHYLTDLEAKKYRLLQLKKNIVEKQTNQTNKQSQIQNINKQITLLDQDISNINHLIDIQKKKTCNKDEKCYLPQLPSQNGDNSKCTVSILSNLLKHKGITEQELQKVNPYFDYKKGIFNFDIQTHPEFYKYSKISNIQPCNGITSQLSIDIPRLSEQQNQTQIQNQKQKQTMPQKQKQTISQKQIIPQKQTPSEKINQAQIENQALKIFSEAIQKYKQLEIENLRKHEQELCQWSQYARTETSKLGLQLDQHQIKLLAIGMQLLNNLKKSKQMASQTSLMVQYIINNPQYRQLLNEINLLKLSSAIKKSQLQQNKNDLIKCQQFNLVDKITQIIQTNQLINNEINQIKSQLSIKVGSFNSYHI